jgi:D-arabinose 1-dehydrogenase-like Zn-dependent alcohol dehydrogenase
LAGVRVEADCDVVKGLLGCSLAMLENTVKFVEEHDIHPVIAHVFEWEDAVKAYEKLRSQNSVGKIVIKV